MMTMVQITTECCTECCICEEKKLRDLIKKKAILGAQAFHFYGEIISRQGVKPDSNKLQAITDIPSPKSKKELRVFLDMMNYLNNFSLVTAEVSEVLCTLTSI